MYAEDSLSQSAEKSSKQRTICAETQLKDLARAIAAHRSHNLAMEISHCTSASKTITIDDGPSAGSPRETKKEFANWRPDEVVRRKSVCGGDLPRLSFDSS